jgi:hypothetical protein
MKSLDFGRCALGISVAAEMLAGCGGSQPPIPAPGVMPQSSAIAAHVERGKSWMLPEAKSEDLLYASNADAGSSSDNHGGVLVYAYPRGRLVGELTGFSAFVTGVCSDTSGDVFVTAATTSVGQGYVYEYSHGGTEPIVTLSDPGLPNSCASDPTTGNVAVVNIESTEYYKYYGDVAIFEDGPGHRYDLL